MSGAARGADVQGNAVRAMVNMTGLTHPGHPLHKAGEDGITLFMGELPRVRLSPNSR